MDDARAVEAGSGDRSGAAVRLAFI